MATEEKFGKAYAVLMCRVEEVMYIFLFLLKKKISFLQNKKKLRTGPVPATPEEHKL